MKQRFCCRPIARLGIGVYTTVMSKVEADSMFKSRRNRSNVRKRPASEEDEDDLTPAMEEREAIQRGKLQKKAPNTFTTNDVGSKDSVKLMHESNRTLQQATDQGATREVETETATDRDARQVFLLGMISTPCTISKGGAGI